MKNLLFAFCLFSSGLYAQSIEMKGATWADLEDEYISVKTDLLSDNVGFFGSVLFDGKEHILQQDGEHFKFKFLSDILSLMGSKGYHYVYHNETKYSVIYVLRKEN